ncbi:MAG: penicillin-binding protein activator [Mariprofundaceae bacterium]|nr:penicillin-binding protein activator [Mariprofundaceae bacterium]
MNRLYPTPISSAIFILLIASLLSACANKQPIHSSIPSTHQKETSSIQLLAPPQNSQEISDLLQLTDEKGGLDIVLDALQRLSNESPTPLKEEAAFRRIELLLKNHYPNALAEAKLLLQKEPNHALAAYAHFWIALWWQSQDIEINTELSSATEQANMILDELTQTLRHPRLTRELAQQALALGRTESPNASHEYAINWYLAAAHIDTAHKDEWLRAAASNLSLQQLLSLQQAGMISPQQDAMLYSHFSRLQLMSGNIENLQTLSNILSDNAPYLPLTQKIKRWASGDTQDIYIGILLPLTGPYANFGKEALNGIRLAMSEQKQGNLHLYIEDTGDGVDATIAAYQKLNKQSVDWIIGPLLSKHTEALLPYLKRNIPIISLSKQNNLAKASPALFIHNVAKNTQAVFMAQKSINQGLQRMAVISGTKQSEVNEAETFANEFIRLGGEITSNIALHDNTLDQRNILNDLRENSDDEALLEELLSDLALFSPELNLEVHMPVGIDGLYIATSGKKVSELAGQLAYVDIRNIPILGSSRWMDGHLLDDRGRNLSSARFIQHNTNYQDTSNFLEKYREIWGQGQPKNLFVIAYDSTRIATLLGSRLGLHGYSAIQAMHDTEGFPNKSGHVYFNEFGVGNKTFKIFKIKRGKLVPSS